jgi:hypothetical protein
VSFVIVVVLYAALAVATVTVLRVMSQRWRREDMGDDAAPYGPRPAATSVEDERALP